MSTAATKTPPLLVRRWVLGVLGVFGLNLPCAVLWAQSPGLYDPQPPANAAYVRVLVGGSQAVDVLIDQHAKASNVPAARPSSYMLVSPGAHQLTVRAGGNRVHVPLNVVPSRFLTVLLSDVHADAKPVVIEDKLNGNRLKAMLSVYHLGQGQPVEVWTADGQTPIFSALAPNQSAALAVNPINVHYMVTAVGQKKPLAQHSLTLAPGGAYSMVITSDSAGRVTTQTLPNTTERFASP